MKKNIVAFSISLGIFIAPTLTMAACPENLKAEQLTDCIVVEGAGQSYDDYLKEIDSIDTTASKAGSDSNSVEQLNKAAAEINTLPASAGGGTEIVGILKPSVTIHVLIDVDGYRRSNYQ